MVNKLVWVYVRVELRQLKDPVAGGFLHFGSSDSY